MPVVMAMQRRRSVRSTGCVLLAIRSLQMSSDSKRRWPASSRHRPSLGTLIQIDTFERPAGRWGWVVPIRQDADGIWKEIYNVQIDHSLGVGRIRFLAVT